MAQPKEAAGQSSLPREQAPKQFMAPAPPVRSTDEPPVAVNLSRYLAVLSKRKWLIALGTMLLSAMVCVISLLLPKVYESTVTLIISPPAFSTELKTPAFSVDTYAAIAESADFKRKLTERLKTKGFLEKNEGLGAKTDTVIYAGKLREQPFIPVIDLVVEAGSPQRASLIANTWAEIVVEQIGDLSRRSNREVVTFIDREYTEAKERLAQLEMDLKNADNEFDRRIERQQSLADEEIGAFKARWNLDRMSQELRSLQSVLTEPHDGLMAQINEVQLDKKRTHDKLKELRKEIQAHPKLLILSKAITDDALWERTIPTESSDRPLKDLGGMALRTEQLNPVHSQLAHELANTQVEYDSLIPWEDHLQKQIQDVRGQIEQTNGLIQEKQVELRNLERRHSMEARLLRRERDLEIEALRRDVENARKTFETLSAKFESARLAKAEETRDVKIAAQAVPVDSPVRPLVRLNTVLGALLGLILSVGLAFVLEAFPQKAS